LRTVTIAMNSGTLVKVAAKTAAEVCKRFTLSEPAQKLLRPELTPRQFLDLLVEKQQPIDAVRFLAYGLPKPEAVWGACLCVRSVAGVDLPPKAAALRRRNGSPTPEKTRHIGINVVKYRQSGGASAL